MRGQQKEVVVQITESSCIHVTPVQDKPDLVLLNWRMATDVEAVHTYVKLSKGAAIKTAQALLAFLSDDPAPSA